MSTNYKPSWGVRTPYSAFPANDKRNIRALHKGDRIQQAIQASKARRGMPLSDTTLRYVAALWDPRDCYESVCVPHQAVYSEKQSVFVRGQFNTGTTGVGFVVAKLTGANDVNQISASTSTSVGGLGTTLASFTNQTTAVNNSRYATASFGTTATTLNWRPVAASLYVRYAGTELNRGGDYIMLEEPNHNDILNQYTPTQMLSQDGAKRLPIGTDWEHVNFVPNTVSEVSYLSNQSFNSGNYLLGVAVSSAGASQVFDYEFHMHFEAVGSIARAATVSFNDPIGFDIIVGAGAMYQQLDSDLGIDGFMEAIHAQMANLSGVMQVSAPHGNWRGLIPFLPQLKALAQPFLNSLSNRTGVRVNAKTGDIKVNIPKAGKALAGVFGRGR